VSSPLDSEQRLEDMIAEDPRMSGTDLLIIGRQVPTGFGGFIDLLALDAEGRVHVLELKRDRTPRDVVAQALDYGSVFFRHFADGGCEYLARTWLLDPQQVEDKAARPSRRKLRPCNGRDFYVILGRAEPGDPRRPIAHKYGFLNAGGGSWYWKPLRNLVPGNRVFAYVGGAGYVGIGRVTGKMIPARDAKVEIAGQRQWLVDQPEPSIGYNDVAMDEDPEVTEMVVPVEWLATKPLDQAVREKGLFASQVTVCKLRDAPTIATVESAFGLNTEIG